MSLESRNVGARAALETLSLRTKTAINWSGTPDDQFAPELDQRLTRLWEQANKLRVRGGSLPQEQLLEEQLRLARRARVLQSGHAEQVGRNLAAYNRQFELQGIAPQAPQQASLLNRLTRNYDFPLLGRFGTPANMPAEAHRAKDIAAAMQHVDQQLPDEVKQLLSGRRPVPAVPRPAGGLGRLALGAGALVGGGYLLKNLMSRDEPAQAPINPYAQLPAGY